MFSTDSSESISRRRNRRKKEQTPFYKMWCLLIWECLFFVNCACFLSISKIIANYLRKKIFNGRRKADRQKSQELNHWLCCGFLLTNKKFKVATEVVSFEVNGLKKLLMGIGFLLLNWPHIEVKIKVSISYIFSFAEITIRRKR